MVSVLCCIYNFCVSSSRLVSHLRDHIFLDHIFLFLILPDVTLAENGPKTWLATIVFWNILLFFYIWFCNIYIFVLFSSFSWNYSDLTFKNYETVNLLFNSRNPAYIYDWMYRLMMCQIWLAIFYTKYCVPAQQMIPDRCICLWWPLRLTLLS